MQSGALWVAVLIPLLPLMGAAIVGVLGSRVLKGASHWPVILGIAGAAVCSFMVFSAVRVQEHAAFENTYRLYSWISPQPGMSFDVNFRIDPLTAIMLTMVCTVATLVAIYSRDYMRSTEVEASAHH
jgi:NADH:ubiquinone oxidoreductase subunit 5 (subunit L)/multisubunit Na+/H+ antiporter MnhA subunit